MIEGHDYEPEMREAMEAEGFNPDLLIPIYDLIGESAVAGAKAKAKGDGEGALICYGRVSGLFDALVALDLPVPATAPSDVFLAAQSMLEDPEAAAARIEAALESGASPFTPFGGE